MSEPTPTVSSKVAPLTLALLFGVAVFNYTDRYMIGILLPGMKAEFHLTDTQMGFLTGIAFTFFYVLVGIPIARLADKHSRKKILITALSIWSLMTAACGLVQNFVQLVIARMMVGIAEAGSSPPSYSVISDLYPTKRRAGAVSIYLAGSPAGILIGFTLGGWLAEQYNWRVALIVAGLPGLLFALVLAQYLIEPRRGGSDDISAAPEAPPFRAVIGRLISNPTFMNGALGNAFYNALIVAYVSWLPSFFVRTHGLGLKETGVLLALLFGPVQLVGGIAGGFMVDRLSRFDIRWYLRAPALVVLAAAPLFIAALSAGSASLALACFVVPLLIGSSQTAPGFAVTQSLVEPRMRAVASAVLILIINIVSGGFGPVVVGFLSDSFEASRGADSLKYALLVVTPILSVWASLHYFLASRYVRGDLGIRSAVPETR